MRVPENNEGLAPAHSRYRALLDVSAALIEQPTVKAVLHSLREVLSSSVRLHGADLYLLDSGQETLHLLEFDRAEDAPEIRVGTKISRIGAGVSRLQASQWLGGIGFVLFMLGRLCGSAVISQFQPHRVLAIYSGINVALVAITMGGGKAGLYAMFASFFFMSVGFPTIFALGIRGFGEHTKLASSLIVMSIVGGAIAPPFMGHIADRHTMRLGFVVPLVCFGFVALYGMMWASLSKKDIWSDTESH